MTDTSSPDQPPPSSADPSPGSLPEFAPTSAGNKAALVLGLFVAILAVALVIGFFGVVRHWFALHTGITHGGPDVYYNFWSGFGSDLGEATLISAVVVGVLTGVRKVNCHTKGCWRIGHHPLDGTPYILCSHHHPHVPNGGASHDDILLHHHRHKLEKAAEKERAAV